MNKVNFPFWDDEVEKAITEIYRVKSQIQSVGVRLKTNDISDEEFSVLLNNVYETLKYWTGHTYIGQHKKKNIQKAYQTFFEALYDFLFLCRELGNPVLKSFADEALYRGLLYRYLGYGFVEKKMLSLFGVSKKYSGIFINDMRMSVPQRRKGVGTKVVNKILRSDKTYMLEPVEDGKTFWKKFGFKGTGKFVIREKVE